MLILRSKFSGACQGISSPTIFFSIPLSYFLYQTLTSLFFTKSKEASMYISKYFKIFPIITLIFYHNTKQMQLLLNDFLQNKHNFFCSFYFRTLRLLSYFKSLPNNSLTISPSTFTPSFNSTFILLIQE